MHNICRKANNFKSADVSMLVNGYGVSQYPELMKKFKINMSCYHVHMWEVIQVKKITIFLKNNRFVH